MILILLTCGISAEETLSISTHKSWLTSSLGSGKYLQFRLYMFSLFTFSANVGLSVLVAVCIAGHVSVRIIKSTPSMIWIA